MQNLVEHIARLCTSRERRILGYDLERCMQLKFKPGKLERTIDFPYKVSKSDVLPNDITRWLVSHRGGLNVQRTHLKDAYSINDIRYTHYIDYETGEVRIYDEGNYTQCRLSNMYPVSSD